MVLANLNKKRFFDVKCKEDLGLYKEFLATGSWKQPCPFELEQPYLEIPYMIANKIANKYLEKI